MIVPKLHVEGPLAGATLDEAFARTEPQQIACCNWPEAYPYAPKVAFRMFHTGEVLAVRFDVNEERTAALVTEDNGPVWTDSCVEFFVAPDESGYYNFEVSCIGRLLLAFRKEKPEPTYAPAEVLRSVERIPSLGDACFAEREGGNRWSMTLLIPPSALFLHRPADWSGVKVRANLYKCGDDLSEPHFLSWRPIRTVAPDFHRPEFFEEIECAEN